MYSAGLLEAVGGKGLVKRVVGVRGDEYSAVAVFHDDGGMVKVARAAAELDYVADPKLR